MRLLSAADRLSLLKLARQTLQNHFQRDATDPVAAFASSSRKILEARPCFVSLYGPGEHLRGCIGCLSTTDSLYANVSRYAELAAFSDPRFPSVKAHEIERLKIHISVLGPLVPLTSLDHIVIGTHGLSVSQGLSRGVLLAQVAVKHGFTPSEFREQTCLKAGLEPSLHEQYEWQYFEEVSFSEE